MPEDTIGTRLRRVRRRRGLTQEALAEKAGVSAAVVQKLEQDRRGSARTTTLIALANALDVPVTELLGKRPRLDGGEDVSVLALRDLLLSPDLLPEVLADRDEAPALASVETDVSAAWAAYWAGRFSVLVGDLPGLVGRARLAHENEGVPAAAPLAQSYQLVANMLVHLGKDDLAALAAERAIRVAERGDDQLQWATLHGTFAWTLLQQGRTVEAEHHAMWVAEEIEPSMTSATLPHLTVWGGVVLWAMAAAVAGGRATNAVEYIGLARSASGRFEEDRHDYEVNFGRSQVAMQETHAYAVLREPGKALKARRYVDRVDLRPISWGRHLIDVAQAQVDAREFKAAESTLLEADGMSSEWFRHQGPARTLVGDLVEESRRLSPPLRRLARTVGADV